MKYLFMITMLFLSNTSFALFCPTNFSQINMGDTIDQVIKTCGNPSSSSSHQKITVLSEQWTYYVRTTFNSPATSKMMIVFSNNKVINISIETNNNLINTNAYQAGNQPVVNIGYNNQAPNSVASTSACGSPISIGDGPQKVANICGKPAFIKQNKSPLTENNPIEITELKYSGITPTTLVFENGVLKERNM